MTQKDFEKHHEQAKAYLSAKHKGFDKLSAKLGLDNSDAFAALITDVFVNTS